MSGETADRGDVANADAETGAQAPAENPAGGAAQGVARRRRSGLIALAVLAVIAGVAGSWVYNSGYKTRATNNSAVIRTAADPSTYVVPGDFTRLTVPIRNDSPYAITVVGLTVPAAPRIVWDGTRTVIQPGTTAYLRVTTPSDCPATPHTLKRSVAVAVTLRVVTASGKSHGGLRASASGVIQYAADYCAVPSASPTNG